MAGAGDIVSLIWRANLAMAAAVALVWLARRPVRLMFGASAAYRLWLLPILAGLAAAAPARRVGVTAQMLAAGPSFDLAAPMWLLALWLTGAAITAALMTRLQMRFVRTSRTGAIGPAVVGMIFPRIVVPADFGERFTKVEQALVLAHEQAHLARQDPRINGLSALVQCLCWFNPLIHVGAHLMRIDQELACDAQVIAQAPEERSAYARALLKAQLAGRALPLGCYWPARAEHPLAVRLDMLARREPDAERKSLSAWLLWWSGVVVWLGVWAAQPPRLELERPRAAPIRGERVPVMAPTGDMSSAVLPNRPNQFQEGSVPLMAPTGDSLPAYTPPERL